MILIKFHINTAQTVDKIEFYAHIRAKSRPQKSDQHLKIKIPTIKSNLLFFMSRKPSNKTIFHRLRI